MPRDFRKKKDFRKNSVFTKTRQTSHPELISQKRRIYKGVSPNVDFYSGFVYKMLGLPEELFTPIFAVARIAGWSAHRLEGLINEGKIIRPAYRCVKDHEVYISVTDR